MAENIILSEGTSRSIHRLVDRLLQDLGQVEPPLSLELVRDRLSLDLKYYSARDVGALDETLHKVRVAGKQVFKRPMLAADALMKVSLKALLLPDQKRILIDSTLPAPKQRWGEAHEIIHDLLPWHDAVAMGDRKRTLSLGCHNQIEAEANYGAGRLLFLGGRFVEELRDIDTVDFQAVCRLQGTFKNSLTTTLWRVVEATEKPAIGLVSQHPQSATGSKPIRYFIRSKSFSKAFPDVTDGEIFAAIASYCYRTGGGPLGQETFCLTDAAGQAHEFLLESFSNTYEVLTLGTYQKRIPSLATVV